MDPGGNSNAVPSSLTAVFATGLGPPPFTQSGNGAALEEVAPLDLIAALLFFLAIVRDRDRIGLRNSLHLQIDTYASFPHSLLEPHDLSP